MGTQRHILVVDDDKLLREGTARIVASGGYLPQTASTGQEALDKLEQTPFDLVLLDVNLPDMSGRDVCRRIRSDARYEGIYVVMVSATHIATDDTVMGLDVGADGYISRPVANRELLARVNAMLRLKAAEEARRRNEAMQLEADKSESIGTISRGIAHDFNNLLSVIMGNIELAMDDCPQPHSAATHLQDAMEACLWATSITNKFLTLSRGNLPMVKRTNLAHLMVESMQGIDIPSNVRMDLDIDDRLPPAMIDPQNIRQAIDYLLTNALEAMPEGGTLTVTLQVMAQTGTVPDSDTRPSQEPIIVITIEDTGCGIPVRYLPKVFDPYFTTKEMGSRKGMGLGLATANAIIQQHGGTLELESVVDKGTIVTIRLPLTPTEASKRTVIE